MKKVAVTGLGLITPLGLNVKTTWTNLLSNKSGIVKLNNEFLKIPCQVGGKVPSLSPDPELDKYGMYSRYALEAAQEALADSKLLDSSFDKDRVGVCIGSGIGNIQEWIDSVQKFKEFGIRKLSPYFVPKILINMAAGQISLKYGLRGPCHSVSTACTTGAHAIGDAYRFIQFGDADIMIAGGTEASLVPLAMAGFSRAGALSNKYNHDPSSASRPFDKNRNGFVMGEGAGVIVLEEYEHALKRSAPIYALMTGYGLVSDAHHITAPPPDGSGAARSMKRALETAGLHPTDIDYINAHATSTLLGDLAETRGIKTIFGQGSNVLVSSIKGSIGHLLGAAGAVEAISTILSIHHSIVPTTLNLSEPDQEMTLNYVAKTPTKGNIRHALSNSFGFGGTNATLVFSSNN